MSHYFVNIKMCLFSLVLYSFLFYFILFLQVDAVHSEKNEKRKFLIKSGWVGGVWPSRHMTCTNQTRASCCCPHVACSFLIFLSHSKNNTKFAALKTEENL